MAVHGDVDAYIAAAVPGRHRDELAHLDVGKGCVRFRRVDQIDHDLVRTMLTETAASRDPVR